MYDNDIPNNTQIDPDWSTVPMGTPVIASDAKRLGTVQERRANGLFVRGETPDNENYLVSDADIGHIATDGVYLIVNAAQAMRAQAEDAATDDPTAGATSNMNDITEMTGMQPS